MLSFGGNRFLPMISMIVVIVNTSDDFGKEFCENIDSFEFTNVFTKQIYRDDQQKTYSRVEIVVESDRHLVAYVWDIRLKTFAKTSAEDISARIVFTHRQDYLFYTTTLTYYSNDSYSFVDDKGVDIGSDHPFYYLVNQNTTLSAKNFSKAVYDLNREEVIYVNNRDNSFKIYSKSMEQKDLNNEWNRLEAIPPLLGIFNVVNGSVNSKIYAISDDYDVYEYIDRKLVLSVSHQMIGKPSSNSFAIFRT